MFLPVPLPEPSPPPLGVYLHFPWCLSKCPYCDFVAYAADPRAIDHAGYADAVLAEFAGRLPSLAPRRLTSVFFGGGTPSLWDPREVGRVLAAILRAFAAPVSSVEVTLECDPSSFHEDLGRAFAEVGINRLSMGVQALDDARLRFLGRTHTRDEAIEALRAAMRAGIPRISADLMYAVADHPPEAPAREARELVELGATHVSAYSLTIEADTSFGRLARRGKLPLCDDAAMAASFFAIDDALTGAGLDHYEVSNYAAPGQKARHNVGYWQGHDYLGLGCGAYGTITSGAGLAYRYRNQPNPRTYLSRAKNGSQGLAVSEERLDGPTLLRERIMLGLRTKDGIDIEAAAARLDTDPYPAGRRAALDRLEARGRVVRLGSRVTVPREAWIWVDDTAATLF